MRPARPPITVTVPAVVAALLILISGIVSERVMARLIETQEANLTGLTTTYLDGLSLLLVPHVLREDIWEVFDALERSARVYEALDPLSTVVVGSDGLVIAASDPLATPTLEPPPADLVGSGPAQAMRIDMHAGVAYLTRRLYYQDMPIGSIHAAVDIRPLIDERSAVITALVVTNGSLALVLAGVGYLGTRRLLRPLRVLTDHLTKGARGSAVAIPAAMVGRAAPEVRRLFGAFNDLVAAGEQRELLARKLAEEERLASLGRLASGMAHEINNPLGGLFNAVDTIRRHGGRADVRFAAVQMIERGLGGIRDVVEATLQTYRPDPKPRPFGREDLDDIRVMAGLEARRRQIDIVWRDTLDGGFPAPGTPVRQALLNLVLNACSASPPGTAVGVDALVENRRLVLVVEDGGASMAGSYADILLGLDAAPPIGGHGGLGLWMTRRVVTEIGGSIALATPAGGGTRIRVEIPPVLAAEPPGPPAQPAPPAPSSMASPATAPSSMAPPSRGGGPPACGDQPR